MSFELGRRPSGLGRQPDDLTRNRSKQYTAQTFLKFFSSVHTLVATRVSGVSSQTVLFCYLTIAK